MNTKLPDLDNNPIATLAAAVEKDTLLNSAGAGEITRLSSALSAPLPFDREQSLKSRQSTVGVALDEFPPGSKFKAAIKAAADLHDQARKIGLQVRALFGDNVKQDHHKCHVEASRRLAAGESDAFEGIESEKSRATRYQAQMDACHAAMSTLGFKQIEHALVIRDEIDTSLSKLISKLKAEDVASAKRHGVDTDYSAETRITVAVRILFARATIFLKPLEKAYVERGPFNFQLVRNTYRDFLADVADWK